MVSASSLSCPSAGTARTWHVYVLECEDGSLYTGIAIDVAARFAQQGRAMVELKLRHTMYMRRTEGELALTREIAEVARQHNARAILLGSYGLSGDMVFVNLKVVQPGNNLVLAAYDYALPLNREVRSLLGLPG